MPADPYATLATETPAQADPYAALAAPSLDYDQLGTLDAAPPKRLDKADADYPVATVAAIRPASELAKLDDANLSVFKSNTIETLTRIEKEGKFTAKTLNGVPMDPEATGYDSLHPEARRAFMQRDSILAALNKRDTVSTNEFGPMTQAYRVKDGQVDLDPYRFAKGIEQAKADGMITAEQAAKLQEHTADAEKAVQQRMQILDDAGANSEQKALLLGAGRGGIMMASAAGAAQVGAKVPGPAPIKAGAAFLAGVGGALASGAAMTKAQEALAPHFELMKTLEASAKLNPELTATGEIAAFATGIPASLGRLAAGARMVAAEEGKLAAVGFVGKQVGGAAALGLGADALIQGTMIATGNQDGYSLPSAATTTALAALLAGKGVKFRDLDNAQVGSILNRGIAFEQAKAATPEGQPMPKGAAPLSAEDAQVFERAMAGMADVAGRGGIPENLTQTATQLLSFRRPLTVVETRVQRASTKLAEADPYAGVATAEPAPTGTAGPVQAIATKGNQQSQTSGAVSAQPGETQTVVFGARGVQLPAEYRWANTGEIQTSHTGEMMGANPRYPLANSRDYSQPEEIAKQLDTRNNFDPRRHVTDAPDASVGPRTVATVIDEAGTPTETTLGGNNRGWAIANLPADKRAELNTLQNAKAGNFGLAPNEDPAAEIVRHVGEFDLRQPGERERLQGIVDALNPAPGMVQGSGKRAELDAANVPPDQLAGMNMAVAPRDAQDFVRGLIAQGVVDRNLTGALAENPSQAQDYTQRVLASAAFKTPLLVEARMNPNGAGTTERGMLDAAVPALVRMRALGPEGGAIADAVSRTFANAFQVRGTLPVALETAARQTEFDPASIVAQSIAEGLRDSLVMDAKGRPLPEPSAANAATLFGHIERAVQSYNPEPDLFGNAETPGDVVMRAVQHFRERGISAAADGGSAPRKSAAPAQPKPAPTPAALPQKSNVDAEYIAAVQRKDMAAAQRMVDAAANKAGYRDYLLYHGTPYEFNTFDFNRSGSNIDSGFMGEGIYLTNKLSVAEYYATLRPGAARILKVYASIKNPFIWGDKTYGARGLVQSNAKLPAAIHDEVIQESGWRGEATFKWANPEKTNGWTTLEPDAEAMWEKEISRAITKVLRRKGYDGIVADVKGGQEIVVLDQVSQIKSAEPVTYDNAGNVIPLSERFKSESQDIRYELGWSEKGSPYVNVPLRGLPDIRIVEMPELLQLAKDLGASVDLKRMSARGQMQGTALRLNPAIFKDPVAAGKTLAHEIGHLVDYLPDSTLKRGNLWGRIWSLKNFLKNTWTSSGPTNQEFRQELLTITRYWKPYDPATASKTYVKYRESGVELYADFISVLFNSPATAKDLAPKFYKAFWNALTSKPEVKTALFELQQWLAKPGIEKLADRRAAVAEMQKAGAEAFERKLAERKERYAGFRGLVSRLKQAVFDRYAPVQDRARSADTPLAKSVADLFDAHPLADNANWRWLERMHREVVKPLEEAGLTLDDAGALLFYNRVANERYDVSERIAKETGMESGGRSVIANPLGHTPKTARDGLLAMRLTNGMAKQTLLESAVQRFHDEVFDVMKDAHKAGILTDAQMTLIEANRDNYAAFVPLEYVDTFVSAGISQQAGTLKEIANPFISTVLKVLTMHRAIEYQKLKAGTRDFLRESFPAEIKPATMRKLAGGREEPVQPRTKGWQLLELREAGKRAAYEVPTEIATMFETVPQPLLTSALDILNVPFRSFFYPLFIKFNPMFQLVANPIRDIRRNMQNAPAGVGMWGFMRQLPLVKQLGENPALDAVRALVKDGKVEPIIAEMLANCAITPAEATFSATAGRPLNTFDRLLEEHGMLPADEQAWKLWELPGFKQLRSLGGVIETAGKMNELLAKTVPYMKLKEAGWTPRDASAFVRNYAGTPNYGKKGVHVALPNAIFPFFNVWQQGVAADATLATRGFKRASHPDQPGKSRAAWWMRWAVTSGVWTTLKVAAGVGLLGAGLKKLMDGIGAHDKTNYDVIPLGYTGASDVNPEGKVSYLRIPKDPVDRLLSGMYYNVVRSLALKTAQAGAFGDELQQANAGEESALATAIQKNVSIGASDMPGLNPLIKVSGGWKDYASGQNPIDSFRSSPILSDAEHLAGGWDAIKPMLGWTVGQTGIQNFVRYDKNANTTLEMVLGSAPVVNGMVKTTDAGYRQQQSDVIRQDEAARAKEKLSLPNEVLTLSAEYWHLRSLNKHRTPAQESRYRELNVWQSQAYEPFTEALRATEDGETKRDLRTKLKAASAGFQPRK
jgi:hypothetical protein